MSKQVWIIVMAMVTAASGARGMAETNLAELPVRELTVFKDGHAFVMHQGLASVDETGAVLLDALPSPVIGTFWPFSADPAAKLISVSAGQKRVKLERTALTPQELISANVGAKIVVHEGSISWLATIVGIPTRSGEELERTAAPGAGPQLPQPSEFALLKTDQGTKLVHLNRLQNITFLTDPQPAVAQEEFRSLLTMHLDWAERPSSGQAEVGMTYLQKGFRWIPQYRVTLAENGRALVELQATLLNELTDLDNALVHLVIGVPSFDFKDTLDPIALNQTVAQLSPYFQTDGAAFASNFSNSIMLQTQVARAREVPAAARPTTHATALPEIADGQVDDLFVFTAPGITLRKGERMVIAIDRWELSYEDLYKLTIPVAPPRELRQNFNNEQQAELARLMQAPKVKHLVRMNNLSAAPLTTAPTIFLKEGRLIAQGMMTYTPRGGSVDLELTTAVNVAVSFRDEETGRIPNAMALGGTQFDRIDQKGLISLTNHHDQPIRLEVERRLLGFADEVGAGGRATRLDAQSEVWSNGGSAPYRWNWYNWPWWWRHANTFGRIEWQFELQPGTLIELPYAWHYFWARS